MDLYKCKVVLAIVVDYTALDNLEVVWVTSLVNRVDKSIPKEKINTLNVTTL